MLGCLVENAGSAVVVDLLDQRLDRVKLAIGMPVRLAHVVLEVGVLRVCVGVVAHDEFALGEEERLVGVLLAELLSGGDAERGMLAIAAGLPALSLVPDCIPVEVLQVREVLAVFVGSRGRRPWLFELFSRNQHLFRRVSAAAAVEHGLLLDCGGHRPLSPRSGVFYGPFVRLLLECVRNSRLSLRA